MILEPEGWEQPKKILVILAHPDDPEFFCGATIARWTAAGHFVSYCLLTQGDKGTSDRSMEPDVLVKTRQTEQRRAAAILGVRSIHFLENPDGYLVPDLTLRRSIIRVIRAERPDVVVTCDPTNYFPRDVTINHPDHRAAGEAVVGAVYPGAGNHLYFPELIHDEHLEPHPVREVWISNPHQPNLILDITPWWNQKLCALHEHTSQIGDRQVFDDRMMSRRTPDSTPEAPRFEEKFKRIVMG